MKLYKYRSIKNKETFNYYLKALSEGYLWFADIKSLNDPSDSMIYFNKEKEEELFQAYISKNKPKIYRTFIKRLYSKVPQIEKSIDSITDDQLLAIEDMMNNGTFNNLLFNSGATDEDITNFETAHKDVQRQFQQHEDMFRKKLEPIFAFNDTYRHNIKVFSMSDSFDNKHLWNEYAENYGFCIEYDSDLITDEMKDLMDLNPVIYSDKRDHFSWLPLFLLAFQLENKEILKNELEQNLRNQLLFKGMTWSKEKEYRFFSNGGNKVYANIVTGIILHKNILGTKEANQLIKLANDRKWILYSWDNNSRLVSYQSNTSDKDK